MCRSSPCSEPAQDPPGGASPGGGAGDAVGTKKGTLHTAVTLTNLVGQFTHAHAKRSLHANQQLLQLASGIGDCCQAA